MSFTNKVVIVTGGSSGIGAATVVKLAQEGAKVVIVGRNEQRLSIVAEKCQTLNADYHIVKANITNEDDVNRIVKETIGKYGYLDILINGAGIFRNGTILDGELSKNFDEVISTNLKSVAILTSSAAPHLIKTKGNIVNVSSCAGSQAVISEFTAYGVSKAGLNMLTIGTALELASYGVRVNSVSPGPVRTELMHNNEAKANIEDFAAHTALKKICDPEEVADLILFMASDKAKSITGSNFICDNGSSLI